VEVDEPRTGDLDPHDVLRGVLGEVAGQLLGQVAGLAAGGLGRRERDVRRPVAVLAASRTLQLDDGRRFDAHVAERAP
jgi:hypothetical protein